MDQMPPSLSPLERKPWLPALLWTGAGVVSVFAHGAGLLILLAEPPTAIAEAAPPAAIMIEMASEPEALPADQPEISDQTTDSLEVKSDVTEPVETPVEEPVPELVETPPEPEEIPEPVQDVAEALPLPEPPVEPESEPLPVTPAPVVEAVLPPPPPPKPEETVKKKVAEQAKPKPVREKPPAKPAPASKASVTAAAEAAPSNRNAASQTSAGGGAGSVTPAKWQSRLMAHLERRKRYPSGARGASGTVLVRFSIDDDGRVLSVGLARSSGVTELDSAVLELVRRASPVPAPPPGVSKTVLAPVRFTAR